MHPLIIIDNMNGSHASSLLHGGEICLDESPSMCLQLLLITVPILVEESF